MLINACVVVCQTQLHKHMHACMQAQAMEKKRKCEEPQPRALLEWYDRYKQCFYCKKWDSAGELQPGTDKWYCQPCWVWYNAWVLQSQAVAAAKPVPMDMDDDL